MVRIVPDSRVDLLAQVAGKAAPKIGDAAAFVAAYFTQVPDDELEARRPGYLALLARMHWQLARHRPPGVPVVVVASPPDTPHTLVQVVNDDMPFLVDSIRMELARQGFGLHLVVHPVLRVKRAPDGTLVGIAPDRDRDACLESFVCVEIDRETTPAALTALRDGLLTILADVRCATSDWLKMLARLQHVVDDVGLHPPPIDPEDVAEGRALLEWMGDQHFTFLGYREYALDVTGSSEILRPVPGTGLGILREAPEEPSRSFAELPPDIRARARDPRLLVLTKTNRRSTVHRPTYLDYVGVRIFGHDGEVVGEHRFLGLFTSTAYNASPIDIPVLRRKVAAVVDRAGFLPASHDHKDLIAILESFPRDDLFWVDVDTLYETAIGILQLQERRRVRLFIHRETFGRFVSCLVFLPRDRYATPVRERIAALLTGAFGARSHEWNTHLSESVLARLHFVLHVDPNDRRSVDRTALESQLASAARAWTDDLRDALVGGRGEEEGLELFRAWGDAFPSGYQDDFDAAEALADLTRLVVLDDVTPVAVRLDEDDGSLSLKVYGVGAQPSLSQVLPRLTNMGVVVADETPYDISPADGATRWLKHFRLRAPAGTVGSAAAARSFEEAFLAVGRGDAEDDGFNRLVLASGLSWREVALVRAYSRYLRQIGAVYSQAYIEDALVAHARIARSLVELFVTRLDPWHAGQGETDRLVDELRAALDAVTNLDEDRILRALLHLVLATSRTNWFRTLDSGERPPTFVIKLDPTGVPDMPLPRPMFELFVYSPRVEGVHLRAGKVARGGIRWSDRREDYRTEILGLMKAQRVKNVVIVPGGAKGGFVVKRPPPERDALAAEVEACYRLFVASLLEVTDNLVDGVVVPPKDVVRYDGDDPYLVVAADKGTAAFSDIANEIAVAQGFWLGDAFASGGSAGYDHKKMGITARGAWESVKRHFREVGVDVHTTDFTLVGIGDMSGDVFGNGMLLSRHIRLVAAFDHRHVFLDPDPDPAAAYAERERLFALARSSWDDYDRSRISPGGGVHPRSAKSIAITPEVRSALGIDDTVTALAPNELIRALLTAPVDLLWNGGIGTYVKARAETHAEVGDKANEAVRVDGADLRARVVVEGGNLGLTQRGRVEFALAGGLVNTDAIDNSAGVDASDREVNIKILLDGVIDAGLLRPADRNDLLRSMTDEVAALVLRDNYRQNRALANARAQAPGMIDVHTRFIHALVQSGHLNRNVERLPDDETLVERHNAGIGLTAPELAVLLAYAKVALEDDVLDSSVPDDEYFAGELAAYFPTPPRERYADLLGGHPLRREIVTTALVNGMVNRAGTTFAFRLVEETGAGAGDIVRAHEVARVVFGQADLWHDIEALDNQVAADVQTRMYLESRRLIERSSRWLLRRWTRPLAVAEAIAFFAPGVHAVAATLAPSDDAVAELTARGVPVELARRVTTLDAVYCALDVTDLAAMWSRPVPEVATLWSMVGVRLHVDWLRERIVALPRGDRWQALARGALRDDIESEHRAVTAAVLNAAGDFDAWAKNAQPALSRVLALLDDVRAHGVYDLATLSVALREIRNLT